MSSALLSWKLLRNTTLVGFCLFITLGPAGAQLASATAVTNSQTSKAQAGEQGYPGCPPPVLPEAAFLLAPYAKLELTISAGPDGAVREVIISKPSRAKLYDEYTRKWVATHWRMPPAKPGEPEVRKFVAPIVYPKASAPPGGQYPAPEYLRTYLVQHIQGFLIVEINVSPSGKIESARALLSSGHQGLDDSTTDWVLKKWRFPPGERRTFFWPVQYEIR